MDLPKGLVKDDRRIYGDVASLSQPLPSDFIIRMWRLYTTTNLKLVDPTARRLENFWWQVMGSDRSKLRADTLAKIWEHISYGPTFVPLRGSPNRWEGPTTPRFNSQHESDVLYNAQQSGQDVRLISDPAAAVKELSASSSRPPPSHPILKKSRGDSKSGPRPTARFVSPHDSGDEDFKTSEGTSSGSTAASGLEMRISAVASPAKSNKKKPSTPTKRFVASAANKRRPVLPRRQSSQSSTNSDVMVKDVGSANGTKHVGTYNVVHPIAEQAVRKTSASESAEPTPSAKALGKRPANRSSLETSTPLKSPPIIEERRKPVIVQTINRASAPAPLDKSVAERPVYETNRSRHEGPKTPTHVLASSPALSSPKIGSFSSSRSVFSAPRMERTASNSETYRPREASIGRGPSQLGLISSATAKTSTVAAVGHVSISGDLDKHALEALGTFNEEAEPRGTPKRTASSSHFTPTMPSSTPDVPLARTRSQLTLLLEREKERIGDRPRHRS